MISIGDMASQMNICKILAIALPKFYKRTNISAQFVFSYDTAQGGLNFNIGFTPREASEKEYNILFEEIQNFYSSDQRKYTQPIYEITDFSSRKKNAKLKFRQIPKPFSLK